MRKLISRKLISAELNLLKDTLKAFDNFKNKQKSVWSNVFWYVKVCKYTIHWDKTKMFKKISFGQNRQYKKRPLVFFRKLRPITVLYLICDSYMSWSLRFVSLKVCLGFSIFDSVSLLLKFIFLFNKIHGLFEF